MDRKEWLNDEEETFRSSFEGIYSEIWTSLPAIVTEVDFDKQTISAQSAIVGETKDEDGNISQINMPIFKDVVLCFPRGGGYVITFPVKPGDEVLIVFASRCIDGWWSHGKENNASPEFRMDGLSDGFAILAPTSQPKAVANISPDTLRIMSEDSIRYIEISPTAITVQSDQEVCINSENVVIGAENITLTSEKTTITATGQIQIDSADQITVSSTDKVIINATDQVDITSSNKVNIVAATSVEFNTPTINLNGATLNP